MSAILADVIAEGRRLNDLAEAEGVAVRLLGGVAIRLRGPQLPAAFERAYGDLDWATSRGGSAVAQRFFADAGYAPEVAFNALNGKDRLLFHDEVNGRQLDVFVGSFRMCHEIPIHARLEQDPVTLPLAELLMTKLQIVELNHKDIGDGLALLHGHEIGDEDGDVINASHIAALCAGDWGLWRTLTRSLQTCRDHLGSFDLAPEDSGLIAARLDALERHIEEREKSRKWRLRARIGERKRWYELPEEVDGGPG
jgi:hypothetical protein